MNTFTQHIIIAHNYKGSILQNKFEQHNITKTNLIDTTSMQQYHFIKQKLQIPYFPEIATKEMGILKAPEVILFFLALTFLFSVFGLYSLTYLCLGFGIPAVCRYKDIKIFNYWECLAILLYIRTISDTFQTLDGLVLVFLWHPNFKAAQKFIDWIKSFKQKGHIQKGISQIKKVL